jgi:hypothetical protein
MVLLDNKTDADAAKALAQGYTSHCFIGRNNSRPNRRDYIVEYWTGGSGQPGPIRPEDCISYQTTALRIVNDSTTGWSLVAGKAQLLILDNQQDATNALALAKHFTKQCFIGRANTRPDRKAYIVQYWR